LRRSLSEARDLNTDLPFAENSAIKYTTAAGSNGINTQITNPKMKRLAKAVRLITSAAVLKIRPTGWMLALGIPSSG
jgi:UDP-3-O-acyl-N-acetylglucosamine deacetylase